MLPWNLEDWLTEEGDRIVRKVAAANSRDALDGRDRLLYELWLFDTEQRNGGVSHTLATTGLSNGECSHALPRRRCHPFRRLHRN